MNEGHYDLETWWGLSRVKYLTIPRSVMQCMPDEWQGRMAKLLFELDETIDWRPIEGRYWVCLKNAKGRYVHDSFDEYRHVQVKTREDEKNEAK